MLFVELGEDKPVDIVRGPFGYDGGDGLQPRDDLAGLNLTTVPKVLIETGNMRNATDAALLVTPTFQQSAAAAMAQAITVYLTGDPAPAA